MDSINKHLKTLKNNLNKFEKRIEELNLEKNNISEIKDLNVFSGGDPGYVEFNRIGF